MDDNVQTYKVRLVIKCYKQRQMVDFNETFLLIAMLKFIRILFAIITYHDYEIWQIDVKTIYLQFQS